MKPKCRVSVLMPAYNSASFLATAVESIRGQTYAGFEFIIVDDGSTDGSTEILRRYASQDSRVCLLRNNRNRGIVAALNRGLDACRGEYVMRMDSDDISLPDRMEKQIAEMDRRPEVAALGGAVSYIDSKGKEMNIVRHSSVRMSLLWENPLLHPTVTMRRQLLTDNGLRYIERYRYAEDYFLWLQMSRVGQLDALSDVVLKYRVSESASRLRWLKPMQRAAIRVKVDAVRQLKMKPKARDVVRFLVESSMLLFPARLVWLLHWKIGLKM